MGRKSEQKKTTTALKIKIFYKIIQKFANYTKYTNYKLYYKLYKSSQIIQNCPRKYLWFFTGFASEFQCFWNWFQIFIIFYPNLYNSKFIFIIIETNTKFLYNNAIPIQWTAKGRTNRAEPINYLALGNKFGQCESPVKNLSTWNNITKYFNI